MASGFKINKQGIRKMSQEIEREFAKNPVRVPVETVYRDGPIPPAATVNNYHGPVVTVNGDHAQVAWDNDTVNQTQSRTEQIAPGYEQLAAVITDVLANLPLLSLDADEAAEAKSNADLVLGEVVKDQPDRNIIKRGVTMLKGILAPVAAGLSQAASAESAQAARHVIETLGHAAGVLN